jgi:hypothetical protein
MFFTNATLLNTQETTIMENYIKAKVTDITLLFFKDFEGYIPRK